MQQKVQQHGNLGATPNTILCDITSQHQRASNFQNTVVLKLVNILVIRDGRW